MSKYKNENVYKYKGTYKFLFYPHQTSHCTCIYKHIEYSTLSLMQIYQGQTCQLAIPVLRFITQLIQVSARSENLKLCPGQNKPAAKSLVNSVVLQREAVVNTQLSFQRSVKTFDVN